MSKKLHAEGSSDALNTSIEISRFEENAHYQRKTGSTSSKQPPICFHMLCEDIANHKETRLDDEKNKEESAKKHLSFALNLPYVWKPQGSTARPISRGLVDLRSRTPTGELEKNEHLKKELRLTPECFSFLREHYGRLGKMGRTGLGTLEHFYYDEREAMFRFLNMVLCGAVKGVSISREQVQAIVHSATESLELYTKPDTEQDVQCFESENETKRRDRLHVANCLATLLFLAVYITDADLDESKVLDILSQTALGTKLLFKKGAHSNNSSSSTRMPSFAASLIFTVLSYAKSKTFSGANDGIFLKVYGLTNFIETNRIKAVFQPSQSKELGFLAIEEALRILERETETASTYHFFQYAAFCFVVNEPKLIGTDFFLDSAIWKHVVDILCLSLRNNATICETFCEKASSLNIKSMSPDLEVVFGLLSVVAREVCITAQCFEDIVPQSEIRIRILDILVPPRDAPGNSLPVAAIQFVETLFASNLDSVDSIKRTFFADDWKAVLGFVKRSFYYAVANTSNFGASAAVFGLMRHLLYISDAPLVDFVFENTVFRTKGTSARYAPSDLRSPEACCALKRLVDLHTALLSSAVAEIYSDKDPSAVYAAMFANVSELCRCITDAERCPCEPLLAFDLIRSAIKFLDAVALLNTHRGKSVLIKEFTSFVLRGQSLAKIFSFIIYSKYQNNVNNNIINMFIYNMFIISIINMFIY